MIGRINLSWKDNNLYQGKKKTGFSVYFHHGLLYGPGLHGEDQPGKFYKVKWPDGTLSEDFYNRTRAKENCVKVYLESINNTCENDTEKLTG